MRDDDAIIPFRSEEPDLDTFERFFAGEGTPEDVAHVRGWAGRDEAVAQSHADEVREALRRAGDGVGVDVDQRVQGLRHRLGLGVATTPTIGVPSRGGASKYFRDRRTRRFIPTAIWATALTLGVLAAYVGISPKHVNVPAHTYTTALGQRATVRLADGTRVILAPQSRFTVRDGFGSSHRDVELSGEAYFDVTNASSSPFSVHTGRVTTRVLGTIFSVKHYADDPDVLVAVGSGKVSTGGVAPAVLTADMVARVNDSSVVVLPSAEPRDYLEWSNGHLVFTKALANEVATVLGRWYGLTFRFADSTLATQELTGAFSAGDSREEVLQSLQMLLDARMVFKENVVTILPKRGAPVRAPRLSPADEPLIHREVGR